MRTIPEIIASAPLPEEFHVDIRQELTEEQYKTSMRCLARLPGRYKSWATSYSFPVTKKTLPVLDHYLQQEKIPYNIESVQIPV
jgi:hypothetical protein